MGGSGTVFVECKKNEFKYESRLYIDGRNLNKPKPVVISEANPNNDQVPDNNAHLHFDQVLIQNQVRSSV